MGQEATYRYQTVTVPDLMAANCLFVNGTLIHRSEFPNSIKVCLFKYYNFLIHSDMNYYHTCNEPNITATF